LDPTRSAVVVEAPSRSVIGVIAVCLLGSGFDRSVAGGARQSEAGGCGCDCGCGCQRHCASIFDGSAGVIELCAAVALLVCAYGGLKQLSSVQMKCEERGETQAIDGFQIAAPSSCQRPMRVAPAAVEECSQRHRQRCTRITQHVCVGCAECVSNVLAAKCGRRRRLSQLSVELRLDCLSAG
jgi:hypothetical protein